MSVITIIGVIVSAWVMLSLVSGQRQQEMNLVKRKAEDEHIHQQAAAVNSRPPGAAIVPSLNAAGQKPVAKH
jgi:hypothetical protein